MQEIELSQGQAALVDDVDFEFLSQWKWYANWVPTLRGYYAVRKTRVAEHGRGGKRRWVFMARVVAGRMGLEIAGLDVDHIDRTAPLDNQRSNLRVATRSQNKNNQGSRRGSSSRFKGVTWSKASGKWRAYITPNGKEQHLGYFTDESSAALAYDFAAARLHGEFAVLNFPYALPRDPPSNQKSLACTG